MEEMLNMFLTNLQNVYIGMGIFALAYVSNILLSTFYNIKIVGFKFDWDKLITGIIKLAVFCLSIGMLCLVVTGLPIFANYVGFAITEEYMSAFDNVVIISAFLVTSCKYVVESVQKLNAIINKKEKSEQYVSVEG